jgi:hypothetical protein
MAGVSCYGEFLLVCADFSASMRKVGSGEMFPSLGFEGLGAFRGEQGDGGMVGVRLQDAADSGDRHAGDPFGDM